MTGRTQPGASESNSDGAISDTRIHVLGNTKGVSVSLSALSALFELSCN